MHEYTYAYIDTICGGSELVRRISVGKGVVLLSGQRYDLFVTTLGNFAIRLTDNSDKREQTGEKQEGTALRQRSFLQYLCVYHDRTISQEELIDAILGDEGDGDPTAVLKNNLYRSRLFLEKLGIENAKELLRYRQGVYSWAPEVNILLDVELFDELYDRFYADEENPDMEAGNEALQLYTGDFLASASGSLWTLSIRTYYHGRFLKLARDMAEAAYEQGDLDGSMKLCRMVTATDPYDEDSQLLMMKLLNATGQTKAAVKHYEVVRSMFMEQLGVSPSQALADYYSTLNRTDEPRELDLRVIRGQLLEEGDVSGAFFCEYAVFQNIYRLIARSAARTGQAIQLAMTVIGDLEGNPLAPKRCAEVMGDFHRFIQQILRSGDVFTRYSRDQFLIMLPSSSHENAGMALERVLKGFRTTLSGKTTQAKYYILPVLPAKREEGPSGEFVPAMPRWK